MKNKPYEPITVMTRDDAWERLRELFPYKFKVDRERSKHNEVCYICVNKGSEVSYIVETDNCFTIKLEGGAFINIIIEDPCDDIEIIVITKSGEIREYNSYGDYRKDFRFFWSSGNARLTQGSAEAHFNRIISFLRTTSEIGMKIETHRNGLTTIFEYKGVR